MHKQLSIDIITSNSNNKQRNHFNMKNTMMTDKEELDVINVSQHSYSEGKWAIFCLLCTFMWVIDYFFQGLMQEIESESGVVLLSKSFFILPRIILIPLVIFGFFSYIHNHIKRVNLIFSLPNDLREEATRRYGNAANPKAFMLGGFAIFINLKNTST